MRLPIEACLVFVMGIVATVSCYAADITSYGDAIRLAKSNASTPEGRVFDRKVAKWFGERHAKTMDKCTTGVADNELVSFDILMRVGTDGQIVETVVHPETAIATCVKRAVEHDTISE